MSISKVIVRMANCTPRADKFDGVNGRRRCALGLESIGVVEFYIFGRVAAASRAALDGSFIWTGGNNCRQKRSPIHGH